MRSRQVGASGLTVSQLGLGTMTWGSDVRPEVAEKLVSTFVEAGGNLIDTAPVYGGGLAEKIVGKLISHRFNRDDLVIATKAGFGTHGSTQTINTSRRALLEDLSGSLKRLGTDHVDIWQIHAWGDSPLDETLAAIDHAVSSGMAWYGGVCNFIGWQLGTAAAWQKALPGRTRLVSAQVEYSLLARRAEIEVLPALEYHDMGFFPWSPLGRGVLTGKYAHAIPRDSRGGHNNLSWFVEPYLDKRSRAVVEAIIKAGQGLNLTPAQVALLWVRDAPSVTAPLLGARTVDQLHELLDTEDKILPDPIISALDDITGGPNQLREPAAVKG